MNTENKTPAVIKWETEYCLDGTLFVKQGEEIICAIQGEDGKITPQMEDNAALIAAAPQLYKALEILCKEINLSKLNVRKDFSLLAAHAQGKTALHNAKKQLSQQEES